MQIRWYDWIIPTNPFASIVIGCLFILFLVSIVWADTRNFKTTGLVFISGLGIILISVVVLSAIGFYT